MAVLFSLDDRKVHGNGKDQDALLIRDLDRVSGRAEALARRPHLTKSSNYVIKSSLVAWEVDPFGVRLATIAIDDRKEIARQAAPRLTSTPVGHLRRSLSRRPAHPAVGIQIPLPIAFPEPSRSARACSSAARSSGGASGVARAPPPERISSARSSPPNLHRCTFPSLPAGSHTTSRRRRNRASWSAMRPPLPATRRRHGAALACLRAKGCRYRAPQGGHAGFVCRGRPSDPGSHSRAWCAGR